MPKNKSGVPWRDSPVPQTPLQREVFMDACVSWMVHEPDDEAMPNMEKTSVENSSFGRKRNFVSTHSELNTTTNRKCSFCDNPSTNLIFANPFAQRCYILLCVSCVKQC